MIYDSGDIDIQVYTKTLDTFLIQLKNNGVINKKICFIHYINLNSGETTIEDYPRNSNSYKPIDSKWKIIMNIIPK